MRLKPENGKIKADREGDGRQDPNQFSERRDN